MMNYVRLTEGLNHKGLIIPVTEDLASYIKNPEKDYYTSLYQYHDKHLPIIKIQKGSISGIEDVTGRRLYFDFDSKEDLELAKKDTIACGNKLVELGFNPESIQIYFSGNKGFGLELPLNQEVTPYQFRNITFLTASNLNTFDRTINNPSRIIRLVNTKHEKSGLYKIQLTKSELESLSIQEIKDLAKVSRPTFPYVQTNIPVSLLSAEFEDKAPKPKSLGTEEIDWTKKPKWLTNCRYALQHGLFNSGTTSYMFLVLAATYKNQGFSKELILNMLEEVAFLQHGHDASNKVWTRTELDKHIISQIFGNNWRGGQYSCKTPGNPLSDYCNSLGDHKCHQEKKNEAATIQTEDIFNYFSQYTKDYDKNILFTGIPQLDKKLKLMVGTSNAILAAAGSGKTSIALQILKHNSVNNVPSLFFSYDMFYAAVYTRMVQQLTGLQQDQIYSIFKNDKARSTELEKLIKINFDNVHFCFKSGQTPEEMRQTIRETEQKIGQAIKLVVVDYSELVIAKTSDPTAASAEVAQKLRELASTENVCMLTLLQPSKLYANPADDFNSAQAAKGSGSIQQSMTTIIGCSRPGFNPQNMQNDKFFNITCLKNRNGGLFNIDFRWDGVRGVLNELEYDDVELLEQIRNARKIEKASKNGW